MWSNNDICNICITKKKQKTQKRKWSQRLLYCPARSMYLPVKPEIKTKEN